MNTFRKATQARSVMFAVRYEDGRTAYMVIENHGRTNDDHMVGSIARERQEAGVLPEGNITGIKRVR